MNPIRVWIAAVISLTRVPLLQATAVAGATLMLVITLIDATVTEGRLTHELFFTANPFPNLMFLGVSVILGGLLLRAPRLQPKAGLTSRALYIYGFGLLVALVAIIIGRLLS